MSAIAEGQGQSGRVVIGLPLCIDGIWPVDNPQKCAILFIVPERSTPIVVYPVVCLVAGIAGAYQGPALTTGQTSWKGRGFV